jgi:hypothetical protein
MKSLNKNITYMFLFLFLFQPFSISYAKKINDASNPISNKLNSIYKQCIDTTKGERLLCQQNCGAIIESCYDQQSEYLETLISNKLISLKDNEQCNKMAISLSTNIKNIIQDTDNYMVSDASTSQFQVDLDSYLFSSLDKLSKQCK